MPFGWRKRKRFERVASLELPPGQWERAWTSLRRRDVLGRIGLALLAAVAMCAVIRGWDPPFPYRTGYTPPRDIVAAVAFTKADPVATEAAQQRARSQSRYVYVQDAEPLVQLRAKLRNTLVELTAAPTLDKLDPKIWKEFQTRRGRAAPSRPAAKQQEEQFRQFRAAFTPQERLDRVEQGRGRGLRPLRGARPVGQARRRSSAGKPGGNHQSIPAGHPDVAADRPRQRRVDRRRHGDPRQPPPARRTCRPWPTGCSPGSCRG